MSADPTCAATAAPSVAGLFAGVGGFELGLGRAGFRTGLLCENEEGAQNVLRRRFPDIPLHSDIRTLQVLPGDTKVLVAGFPCVDLSQAGARAGLKGDRSGLVREIFRLLRQHPVEWVVLENVPFMLRLAGGEAMQYVLRQLKRLKYRWAYRVVNSMSFGIPQRRERVFIVASLRGDPRAVLLSDNAKPTESVSHRPTANGFYWTEGTRGLGWGKNCVPTLKGGTRRCGPTPPAVVLPGGRIIVPDIRDAERLQGFSEGWTKPAEETAGVSHRWRLVGNAVTANVAQWIGRRLTQPGSYSEDEDRRFRSGDRFPNAAYDLGDGPFTSPVSSWPVARRSKALADFLRFDGRPLSERATAGFFRRLERSSLNLPDGFKGQVQRHLERVRGLADD